MRKNVLILDSLIIVLIILYSILYLITKESINGMTIIVCLLIYYTSKNQILNLKDNFYFKTAIYKLGAFFYMFFAIISNYFFLHIRASNILVLTLFIPAVLILIFTIIYERNYIKSKR